MQSRIVLAIFGRSKGVPAAITSLSNKSLIEIKEEPFDVEREEQISVR